MGFAKRVVTLIAVFALGAAAAKAATDSGPAVVADPTPLIADEPIRVAQFLLGDELTCAFDAWADPCMMRELRSRLERLGPGLADRYEADYYRWLLQSTEGAMTLVRPEVDMIDIDFMRAAEAMRVAWQGNPDAALESVPSIRNPEARISALRAIAERFAYSGVTDNAIDVLQEAAAELPLLTPGARIHAAEEIAWSLQRLGDDESALAAAGIGQAALAESEGPPAMVTLAGMSIAGSLCAVSPEEAGGLLTAGASVLQSEERPTGISEEDWHFATVLASAWASRSYARCGDFDTANQWAERVVAGLEGLSTREQAHVYAAMVRRID